MGRAEVPQAGINWLQGRLLATLHAAWAYGRPGQAYDPLAGSPLMTGRRASRKHKHAKDMGKYALNPQKGPLQKADMRYNHVCKYQCSGTLWERRS